MIFIAIVIINNILITAGVIVLITIIAIIVWCGIIVISKSIGIVTISSFTVMIQWL